MVAEKGCYYRATPNSTSATTSVSRARTCSSGYFEVRDVNSGYPAPTSS